MHAPIAVAPVAPLKNPLHLLIRQPVSPPGTKSGHIVPMQLRKLQQSAPHVLCAAAIRQVSLSWQMQIAQPRLGPAATPSTQLFTAGSSGVLTVTCSVAGS